MPDREVVYGLLDTSASIGDAELAGRCRELSLAWLRYDYHGPVIEDASVDEIVRQALEDGYRYCFILAYGQVIHERWMPGDDGNLGFLEVLVRVCHGMGGMVTGDPLETEDGQPGLDDRCLLIDLDKFARCGRPGFEQVGEAFIGASRQFGFPVNALPTSMKHRLVDLQPLVADSAGLRRILKGDDVDVHADDKLTTLDPLLRDFLRTVQTQTANARRGVFLLNIESHADVELPRSTFAGPVSSLYSVAAGFKPNRILQTHGMADASRVVFFDYSRNALAVRKVMVEEWDGVDFPGFMRYLFAHFPAPDTFYQLWAGATSETIDWSVVDVVWQTQLGQLGGAEAFAEHWQQYRQLRHEFVHCDVMEDPQSLLERIWPGSGAVIWFSNVAFTMYANWRYAADERRNRYRRWIECIAALNPEMLLYGSDYINSNVNCISAGEYWRHFRHEDRGDLYPCKLYEQAVRM